MDSETTERDSENLRQSTLPQPILVQTPTSVFEEWRRLISYPDYAANNMGEIYRLDDHMPMPWWWDERGYRRVHLWNDQIKKQVTIHKMVAEVFLPPQPSPKHTVNHIDGVKDNNWAHNLEWATHQEQADHAMALGLWKGQPGRANGASKLTDEQVKEIRALRGKMYQKDIAKMFNISQGNVHLIQTRKHWGHLE